MRRIIVALPLLAGVLIWMPEGKAQTFAATGTTSVGVTVVAEASLSVSTTTTTLTSVGTLFANYTGTTNLVYKIRTTGTTGSGSITAEVTTDFAPSGGPSVATPPTAGDTLAYTCTGAASGTPCSGSQTSSTTAATNVAAFGAGASSTYAGDAAGLDWTLINDPKYATGSYAATVTFTVSST